MATMVDTHVPLDLAPVRGRQRIESLDVLRGIAILGIFYMNIPFMATNVTAWLPDPRRLSWSAADQMNWAAIRIFWDGTQRGLFEFLFGAGVLVFTAKAMKPDDPVAVADLFFRRNLWLILFGLIDIFVVLWIGDILLVYGLSALFLFPFRKLPPRALLAMGLLFALVCAIGWPGGGGLVGYGERVDMLREASRIEAKAHSGARLTNKESETLKAFRTRQDAIDLSKPLPKERQEKIAEERRAFNGTPMDMARFNWGAWNKIFGAGNGTFFGVLEAVCAMFLGMALFKWGVIQGSRSPQLYLVLAICAYAVGCGLRAWSVHEIFRFSLEPKIGWITDEFARLCVTLGHVGLFNLLLLTRSGRFLLAPFKAVGRMAFTVYITTSTVMIWFVFAPWGLGLWERFGWSQLMVAASLFNLLMLIAANLWMRFFVSGPLEWVWRSLSYWKRQPFVRRRAGALTPAAPGGAGEVVLPV